MNRYKYNHDYIRPIIVADCIAAKRQLSPAFLKQVQISMETTMRRLGINKEDCTLEYTELDPIHVRFRAVKIK